MLVEISPTGRSYSGVKNSQGLGWRAAGGRVRDWGRCGGE